MLDLNDFYYFVHVVDRGGITAASRSLSMPKSTISFRMMQLEATLGTRLINRTSRQFSVTDAGRDFYEHATRMLEQAHAAELAVRQRLHEPGGIIRITTAVATAQFATSKVLSGFLSKFPKTEIVQLVSDTSVDLIAENVDIAIRAHSGDLPDSNLVRRTLGHAPWRLFASTAYIERSGLPDNPTSLASHACLAMSRYGFQPSWRLRHMGGEISTVIFRPRFSTDDLIGLKAAALEGLGIVALPAYICKDDLARGIMQIVLPEWSAGESTLTALFVNRQGLLPASRAFVDYLAEEIPSIVAI